MADHTSGSGGPVGRRHSRSGGARERRRRGRERPSTPRAEPQVDRRPAEGPEPREGEGLLVYVAFRGGRREGFCNPHEIVVRSGDLVVVEADRGQDLGQVTVCQGPEIHRRRKQAARALLRHATPEEAARLADLWRGDAEAFEICRGRVKHFSLDMKVIDAETQFDGNRITFYFTAERRVDFRELVRDLASIFRTRIELRQVGARDAARRSDGMGPCGRRLCCTTFLHDFEPVSLKMAKEQNLPLNPAKISGSCGRLMCCMNYEAHSYQAALRAAPRPGSRWRFAGADCAVARLDVGNHRLFIEDSDGALQAVDLDLFREQAVALADAQGAPAAEAKEAEGGDANEQSPAGPGA